MKITINCQACGKAFQDFASRQRKYCSKACQPNGPAPIEVRFARSFNPTPTDKGCLLWLWHKDHAGYGWIYCPLRKRQIKAHRVAWELANGPIPQGLLVLHRCDNPPCVNVSHLFLGTNADNMADKVAKGRQPIGEEHGQARLTIAAVLLIREQYASGRFSFRSLGEQYKVSGSAIRKIVLRLTWAHLP